MHSALKHVNVVVVLIRKNIFNCNNFRVIVMFKQVCLVLIKTNKCKKKSCIRETLTLLTDADSRIDTNLKRLRDLSLKKK